MSPTHCPITPLSKIASLTSSSGNTSTVVPRLKAEKDTNTSYKHKHRRTTAICMPNSLSASARSGFRTVPLQPPPRMPSAYASRHSDPDEEGDVPRPLPRSSFGRNSRNHSLRKEENFAKLPVVREKPRAEQTLQRQGVEVFASRYSLDGDTSQDQRLGLTSSRLPRSSSSNWHLHQPSMLRPCAQGNREKSPQRLTTAKLTPFVATATHTSEQPPQEGYLSPLGAENTPIPPVDPNEHIAGSATKPGPANDNVYTSHRQHKRSNAVYIPRSSTDWRLHTYAMLPHPLPTYISRRPGGQEGNAECAPRRLTTTHLSPFATAASPSGPLPSQNERRANVPTGARHTSESSIAITQRQLLQPLGPPIPRSRTMSSLVPAPESITNTRQASPSSSPSSGSPQSSWNPQPSLVQHAQPTAYWGGRFTALNDRFRNEDTVLKADKRMSEERRTRRIFIHLESLCLTQSAKDSLAAFESVYKLQHQHLQLSAQKKRDKDERMNILKRIIGHVRRKSNGGGSSTGEDS